MCSGGNDVPFLRESSAIRKGEASSRWVGVNIYVYIYYVCIYTHTYLYMYVYVYICVYMYVYVYTHTYILISTYIEKIRKKLERWFGQ